MADSKKEVKTLGVIPARGGSKGIPRKNIALLSGKPLIHYTIREAKRSRLLDAFIVSTDDPKIAAVARSLGADVPFLRPKKFARDRSPDIEFLDHALAWLERHRGWRPDIVVNLRPTAPLRTADDIDRVILLMRETGCDSVRTVSPPNPHNPYKMWLFTDEKRAAMKPLIRTAHYGTLGTDVPRQLLPQAYWQNGLVDATRSKFIRRGVVYGPDVRGVITDPRRAVDIDEPKDLKRAEIIMRELELL
ncbi:MAG: acylneuraminate cytidylyltransferase family protein [Candidatus Sungbacteria bacterium]|uniref:Acylneuraminate cytidylyltransferase family protein n=1 Tax=Candidatus Sungiibacteriota bacterium TaxID=2750080 RepID=A0A932YWR3_9BACT|nr:acylneuraminate cytidylyltransferase family protein [Candidatus Sungbacteria bacterium]